MTLAFPEIAEHGRAGYALFERFGVVPFINCAGVRTQFGGCAVAPEVIAAMAGASAAFVDLDELADGIGQRIADLTGAPWGMVSACTAASLALATAACIAGNDPEVMLKLPLVDGERNVVLMLDEQRFDYEQAMQAAGARIRSCASVEALGAAIDSSVAMICLLGRTTRKSGVDVPALVAKGRAAGVPILVDAAGMAPASPDPWVADGVALVAYSGGKYLRGPASTGLLLGDKSLCQAAWYNGPPHQGFGRAMKVGKEEMVGAVVALERWLEGSAVRADRERCDAVLALIAGQLAEDEGLVLRMLPASEHVIAARLRIEWDTAVYPASGPQVRQTLLQGTLRIMLHDFWLGETHIVIDPFNMAPSDAPVLCDRLRAALRASSGDVDTGQPLANAAGAWQLDIDFLGRFPGQSASHRLILQCDGARVTGSHQAGSSTGLVTGTARGDRLDVTAAHPAQPCTRYYRFLGTIEGDEMTGEVRVGASSDEHRGSVFMEQFGRAPWRARRVCGAQLS